MILIIDNKTSGKVGDILSSHLTPESKLSVVTGAFSIYGFNALSECLNKIQDARLIITQLRAAHVLPDNQTSNLAAYSLTGDKFEIRLRNELKQASVAKKCAQWIQDKTQVRAAKQSGSLNQTLFHVENGSASDIAIQGSSQFTHSGLGYSESTNFDINMGMTDSTNIAALGNWFDAIWNNPGAVEDAKQILLDKLELLYKDQSPQFIYFLTLFNLFRNYLEDLDEEKIIRSKTGFKHTLVWNKLYKFQKDGVLGAIDKLERYGGSIIADSVGLGKTFEALAIIKYYELRNDRVLVLCPKKLRDNWTLYAINDKRNILAADRFNYDVLNHTDLTRDEGQSGEINLASINWGNYDLIVIDESHNFRNNNPRTDGKTRYSRLMQEVIQSGVKTKVLMLSATPVNNRMNDLKNQVAFITEGRDNALADHGIKSIEQTLKQAQTRFNQWVNLSPSSRTVAGLMDNMNFDYFKLLDLLTIARSRKHIEKYYGTADIGEFPVRLKPKNIKADIDSQGQFPTLHEINRTIRRLHMSAYAPLKYVRMDKREEYNRKYDKQVKGGQGGVFKQVDREQSLIHLMRVNLFKRMESSINSFAMTVEKLLNQVMQLLERIETHEAGAVEEQSIEDIDVDSSEFEALAVGNKVKVLIQDMDLLLWKQDLQEDKYQLQLLLEEAKKVNADRDAKLSELKAVITAKVNSPINQNADGGNKKVIVFTAFADTAIYLYQQLATWAEQTHGIYAALITGAGTNKTTLKGIDTDLGNLLTQFSPISKERERIDAAATTQIDLLIATDCISEGQNLQDCDFLVNYDIHWNPVRIIQRFGRIDRLGSKNGSIQLVNFWPNMELDEYINLEARVSGRMVLLDISATGEENVIDQDENHQMNDLEYRRKQLEQLQEAVVDLEDLAGGVSITDMTLNDFRMDLSAYMQAYLADLEQAPTGLYAVTKLVPSLIEDGFEPGVIFCLRNIPGKPNNKVQVDSNYALSPHFMVYVTDAGEVKAAFTRTKQILDVMKKQASTFSAPDDIAVAEYNRRTKQGVDMQAIQKMLAIAIDSIVGKSQEKGVLSLFSRGGTVLDSQSSQGIDDFEVVSYLVLQ